MHAFNAPPPSIWENQPNQKRVSVFLITFGNGNMRIQPIWTYDYLLLVIHRRDLEILPLDHITSISLKTQINSSETRTWWVVYGLWLDYVRIYMRKRQD